MSGRGRPEGRAKCFSWIFCMYSTNTIWPFWKSGSFGEQWGNFDFDVLGKIRGKLLTFLGKTVRLYVLGQKRWLGLLGLYFSLLFSFPLFILLPFRFSHCLSGRVRPAPPPAPCWLRRATACLRMERGEDLWAQWKEREMERGGRGGERGIGPIELYRGESFSLKGGPKYRGVIILWHTKIGGHKTVTTKMGGHDFILFRISKYSNLRHYHGQK